MSQASTRRDFFRTGLTALSASSVAPLLRGAQAVDRALVCVYLLGGNDSNNLVIPLEQYGDYARARGPLALTKDSLVMATSARDQISLGFHPSLSPLVELFNSRALAIVLNEGASPDSPDVSERRKHGSTSHADSSLAFVREGYLSLQLAAKLTGSVKSAYAGFPGLYADGQKSNLSLMVPGGPSPDDLANVVGSALVSRDPQPFFPATGIGLQLKQAFQVLTNSDLKNPIFFCAMSGFDTHVSQAERQQSLFADLSVALSSFYLATVQAGVSQRVTAFTLSEFNRSLAPNSAAGTDHGWGGHQFVIGGSVLGGDVYGKFPRLAVGGPDDATGRGVWAPGVSRETYLATLANWYGVPSSRLANLLPGMASDTEGTLGFLV